MIKTARLELRPMVMSDADQIVGVLNNYEISKWLTHVPFPYTRDDAVWFVNENLTGRVQSWSIFHKEALVGNIGIGGEVGYWLAQDAWGQGFATEAGKAVLKHVFADGTCTDIGSSHFVENQSSQHVLEKLGFCDVGEHVHHSVARGESVTGRAMLLTRDRWQELHDA
jgi:RimJ/RimL family protein N-acetyltransferase